MKANFAKVLWPEVQKWKKEMPWPTGSLISVDNNGEYKLWEQGDEVVGKYDGQTVRTTMEKENER